MICARLSRLCLLLAAVVYVRSDATINIGAAVGAALHHTANATATKNVTVNVTGGFVAPLLHAAEAAHAALKSALGPAPITARVSSNASGGSQSAGAPAQNPPGLDINVTAVARAVGGAKTFGVQKMVRDGVRHPLVFWPGYGASRLHVEVERPDSEAGCPKSGSFHVAFGEPTVAEGWPEKCIYPLLKLQYNSSEEDVGSSFSEQDGVNVSVTDFGSQWCAPIPYEPLYVFLEAIGYTDEFDMLVACYDWRVTPYMDVATGAPHLERARALVEAAYDNTGRPAYLAGHSNGGLQALALLNSSSPEWKAKYVAGFIGLAGNWAGQGAVYASMLAGQSLFDNSWNADAAPAWESWPSSYMSLADPRIYNDSEYVIQAPVNGSWTNYTTADAAQLFQDANLPLASKLGPELIGNLSVRTATPGTNFHGFYGSGQQTLVGVTLPALRQGEKPEQDGNFYVDGDGNQEATDNLSVAEWNGTQSDCFDFQLTDVGEVSHVTLPFSPTVLYDLVGILFSVPKNCSDTNRTAPALG